MQQLIFFLYRWWQNNYGVVMQKKNFVLFKADTGRSCNWNSVLTASLCLWLDDPNLATCWNDTRNNIRVNRNRIGHVTWTDQWARNDSKTQGRAGDTCLRQRQGVGSYARYSGNDCYVFGSSLFWWLLGFLWIFLCCRCTCLRCNACFGGNFLRCGVAWFAERRFDEFVSQPLATNLGKIEK